MGFAFGLGDAKVHQVCEIVWRDDDVVRFDIAMDQPVGRRGVQRRRNLPDDVGSPPRLQRARLEHLVQRVTVHQSHVDV